jgi:hypothetical protein
MDKGRCELDKISYAIENFKNMQELVRFADQKAGALIVIYGFILTMTYEASNTLEFNIPDDPNDNMLGILLFVVGMILCYLIFYQVYNIFDNILKPRLANNYNSKESCLYYFEHVAAKNKSDIMSCFEDLDENKMLSDVAGQIYEVSNTLTTKMEMVSKSITYLYYVMGLMFLFIILSNSI